MLKFAAFFALVAAVSTVSASSPFLLNASLITLGHDHVAKVHHIEHVEKKVKLRFVHLVPKLVHADKFEEFASVPLAGHKKLHAFFSVAHDELFVELLGLTDCATWHATLLGVDAGKGLVHKAFAWVKDIGGVPLAIGAHAVTALAAFLFGHFEKDHFKVLLEKGLPSHALTSAIFKLLK